jgi:O-antigen ligase
MASSDNPEALQEEAPLIVSAPFHARLTQKQRRVLIFLAYAVPFWLILSLLAVASPMLMFVFIAGIAFLIVFYGMRTDYFLFLWLAILEYDLLVKALGIGMFGIGLKGLFIAAVLTQLPNKFSLMPRKLFRLVPARWPLYLFMLWAGASLFWSDYPAYGLRDYLRHLTTLFIFALAYLTANDHNKRLFYIIFAVVVSPSIVFGFLQRFGLGIPLPDIELFVPLEQGIGAGGEEMFRATGFAGQPNAFGRECVLVFLVLLMMLIFWRPRGFWRVVIIGMLGLTLATTVLTYSRAAWAYLIIGLTAFLLPTRPRWLLPLVAAGLIALLFAWPQIWARLGPIVSGTDSSLQARAYARRIYLEQWRLRPLTGYGMGSTGGGALFDVGITPHEGYTHLLAYFGIIGLVLYVFLFLSVAARALKAFRDRLVRSDPELLAMAAFALAIVAILATNFFYRAFFHAPTWYLLGVSLAAPRIARGRLAEATSHSPPGPANNAWNRSRLGANGGNAVTRNRQDARTTA